MDGTTINRVAWEKRNQSHAHIPLTSAVCQFFFVFFCTFYRVLRDLGNTILTHGLSKHTPCNPSAQYLVGWWEASKGR